MGLRMKERFLFQYMLGNVFSLCFAANATSGSSSTGSQNAPTVMEIVMPAVCIVVLCTSGICVVLICRFDRFVKRMKSGRVSSLDFEVYHLETFSGQKEEFSNSKHSNKASSRYFLTEFDLEVLKFLQNFSNKPTELLKIGIPALVTICLGPVSMIFYHLTTEVFWPKEKYPQLPNINQCVSCFLTPAGLVYAISFGFAFSSALNKQSDILNKVTDEISLVDQAATLTSKLKLDSATRMEIYHAIKCEAIYMILQIENKRPSNFTKQPTVDVKTAIWEVLTLLQNGNHPIEDHYVDDVMKRYLIEYISKLNNVCSDDISILHSRTHWLMWVFLISLGFFSLYGVLMIQASSYRMELIMCTLTLFSISMLCYIVSDLDSPFSGFFRIDISIIVDVIYRLEVMHKMAAMGFEETVCYPDSSRFTQKRYDSPEVLAKPAAYIQTVC